jgi:hypothetical protein
MPLAAAAGPCFKLAEQSYCIARKQAVDFDKPCQ